MAADWARHAAGRNPAVIAIGKVGAPTRTGGDQHDPSSAWVGAVVTVRLAGSANAAWACPGAGRPARADVNPSQARAPCRPSPSRCGSARSFAFPAMAFSSPSRPCCPIRIVSVHLLDAAGQLLRVLFLDREGHISVQPHYVPRAEALILASNSRSCLGPRPLCGCSEALCPCGAGLSGLARRGLRHRHRGDIEN